MAKPTFTNKRALVKSRIEYGTEKEPSKELRLDRGFVLIRNVDITKPGEEIP